jgi:hypothetical protein
MPNGIDWKTRRGERSRMVRWLLTRERWEATRRDDITVEGLALCRALLGL